MKIKIEEIFNLFEKKTIMVIGDSMIDSYVWGKINRMSPEAPVPLLNVTKKENRVGGAANVALNLKAMGAKVILLSVIGDDYNSEIFFNLLKKENINSKGILREKGRITTLKKRIISKKYFSRNYIKHHIRIDEEVISDIKIERQFISLIKKNISLADCIILQDYNKGNLTDNVIKQVIRLAKKENIPTLCDPKNTNFYSFKNCTLVKPNLSELINGGGIKFDPQKSFEIEEATEKLRQKMSCDIVMLTMSEKGLFVKSKNSSFHIKNIERKILDVSGAGDTVISIAALCLSQETTLKFMGFLSNLAGGIVCEESGVIKINKSKLFEEALKNYTDE